MKILPTLQEHLPARLHTRARTLPAELQRPARQLINRLGRTLSAAAISAALYILIDLLGPQNTPAATVIGGLIWLTLTTILSEVILRIAKRTASHLDIPSSLRQYAQVIRPAYRQPRTMIRAAVMLTVNTSLQMGPPEFHLINGLLITTSALNLIHLLDLATPLNGLLRAAPPAPKLDATSTERTPNGIPA